MIGANVTINWINEKMISVVNVYDTPMYPANSA